MPINPRRSTWAAAFDAPNSASFITTQPEASLSNESVLGTDIIQTGLDAAKGSPSLNGRIFVATDTGIIYRDTALSLSEITRSEAATRFSAINKFTNGTNPTVQASNASDRLLTLLAAAAQSVNIIELQDSTTAVLASFSQIGALRAASFSSVTTGKAVLTPNADTGGFLLATGADANKGLTIKRNSATQSAILFQVQDDAAANLLSVDATGILTVAQSINAGSATGKLGVSSNTDPNVNIVIGTAASRGIILKGASSQSGALLEAQDSTAAVLANITAAGRVNAAVFGSLTASKAILTPNGDTGGLKIDTGADANKGLIIKRNSGTQSASLFEWQDQTGATFGTFGATGGIIATANAANAFGGATTSATILTVNTNVNTNQGLVIKGASSQSGDLQQWRNSSATVLALVNATGDLKLNVLGKTLFVKEGSNAKMGTGTLTAGTVTISTTAVTASSRIFLSDTGGGVLANIGALSVGTVSAGTSFVVNSSNALDSSNFCWLILEPA